MLSCRFLTLKQGKSSAFIGIGFGLGDKKNIACTNTPFIAGYCIDENHWQGNVSLQLRLKDVKAI